jgi:Asp-tRNA(Asn)/Glu-tRNA(Gln) amidotransferase A subunit family amidase
VLLGPAIRPRGTTLRRPIGNDIPEQGRDRPTLDLGHSRVNLRGLRLAVPKTVFQNDLSPAVANAFTASLGRLSAAGANVVELPMAEFAQAADVNPRGTLTSAEAYSWHRQWVKDRADKYIRCS